MESLGEVGRIQVEERTAKLLMECLCNESEYQALRNNVEEIKQSLLLEFEIPHLHLSRSTEEEAKRDDHFLVNDALLFCFVLFALVSLF